MAEPRRPITARLRDALTGARQAYAPAPPAPPRLGDLAWADPRRLFPAPHGTTPYNPSTLVARQGLAVFDRMRRDEQVKAALTFKKWAVLGGGYELLAPEGRGDTWAPKRFVEEVLDALEETLPGALIDVLSALDYGVSVTEQIWAPGSTRALRGALVLTRLETRAPWSFEFEADEFGRLKAGGFRQDQMGTKAPLPPEKFVVYVHDGLFGNWYGTSDLEAAYRAWWLKENAYKWFAMLLERYGIPPILALFDPNKYSGMTPQQIVTVLEKIQAATVGALPRPAGGDETLTLWAPERLAAQAKDVFLPGFDLLDRHIAKAILMPQLLGFTADAEEGSYARAETHFDSFLLVNRRLQDDLRVRAIERRVIRPLVDLNFGPQPVYPSFRFLPLTKTIRKELFDVWASMLGARAVRRQTTDEAHIRQALDMPEVDEAAVIEDPAPEPALGDDPMGEDARGDGMGARQPRPRPDRRDQAARRFAARAPTRDERAVDYAAVAETLDRLERDARGALRTNLVEARDALLARVAGALADLGVADLDALLRLPGAAGRRAAVATFLRAGFEAGSRALRREVRRRALAAEAPSVVPAEALRWLRAKSLWVTDVLDEGLLEQARLVLLNALKFGELPTETLGKLRAIFEPYVGEPTMVRDGAVVTPHRLETILRTNATEALNQGRLVEARDPDVAPFLHGLLFSAVLDDRTTEVCTHLDGRVIRMTDPDLSRLTPPLHFNALAADTPILTERGPMAIESIEPGTRVWTHRGRWRRVYAVMGKGADRPTIRVLRLATGGALRVTDEHPILTTIGWKAARDLHVGDVLFQHGEQASRAGEVLLPDPQDFPSLFDEPAVPWSIVRLASPRAVVLPVDLQGDAVCREGEVDDVAPVRVLEHEGHARGLKHPDQGGLRVRGLPTHGRRPRLVPPGQRREVAHWVPSAHPLAVAGGPCVGLLPAAVGPMALTADPVGVVAVRDGRLGDPRANGDAMSSAPIRQHRLAQAEAPLDRSDRLASVPVSVSNQPLDDGAVSQVHDAPSWCAAAIISIVDADYKGSVWNLAVDEDETYVAAGVIVHNCRSLLVPVTLDQTLDETDVLTPAQAGRAKELAGQGFV